ncbi:MAG: HepT-like ribonuclease domain-containing protein [Gemmatimonadales bacterium]
MTFLVERLADLREHLLHLRDIRPRVGDAEALRRDLSLRNDILFSLLVVCQTVIDIAGELAGRRGIRFQDYTEAVRALTRIDDMPLPLVEQLERLPGFRNVLIHEYVALDYDRVIEALAELEAVEQFVGIVAQLEAR